MVFVRETPFHLDQLSLLIENHACRGLISSIDRSRLKLHHLLFADDILVFSEATTEAARALKEILSALEDITGLIVNISKSQLFLSVAMLNPNEIQNIIGIQIHHLPVRYLGLPLLSKSLKATDCLPLLDKLQSKLSGWKLLSLAGRLELIKSTLQALKIYWSNSFPLPASTLKQIDKICRSFLWSGKSSSKGGGGMNILE